MKLNSKQWVKVSLNKSTKTIRFTKQIFDTKAQGVETLGTAKNFAIVNKKGIDKLVSEGYTITGQDTQQSQDATVQPKIEQEEWNPPFLVGGAIEEEIRAYVVKKKSKQAIQWIKPVPVTDSYKLSTISHDALTKRLGTDKLDSMKASVNKSFEKYNKRREREEIRMEG